MIPFLKEDAVGVLDGAVHGGEGPPRGLPGIRYPYIVPIPFIASNQMALWGLPSGLVVPIECSGLHCVVGTAIRILQKRRWRLVAFR